MISPSPILALNGWAQPHDGLQHVAPAGTQHVAYSDYASMETLWQQLAHTDAELLIGWSLGGQLAARAVMDGVVRPKALVLIAAPWQFVANDRYPQGMGASTYAMFVENYANQPARTARRFSALVAQGDSRAADIEAEQTVHLAVMEDNDRWLYWLKLLGEWEPSREAVQLLPPTLLIHGRGDGIVPFAQSALWQRYLPQAELLALPDAGHAPQLHAPAQVRAAIAAWAAKYGVMHGAE
jgi:pimeloyl-[acyl-carrier protein] methyl ester esterase